MPASSAALPCVPISGACSRAHAAAGLGALLLVPPGPERRVVSERPPPGLARGEHPAPAWLIGGAGAVIVGLAIAYAVLRRRRGVPE